MEPAELKIRAISFAYPSKEKRVPHSPVIWDLSCSAKAKAVTVFVGPSGCGKTTLLNIVAGLLNPVSGSVENPGKNRFGYVFQSPSLIPWRTIRANALFGAEIVAQSDQAIQRRCNEMLIAFGLGGFEEQYPASLSGGMQQRVSIIRAVLSGAKVILLDEPFSNSDFIMRRELQRELSRLVDEEQLIAILVTHDVEDAIRIGDKIIVLTQRPARVKTEIEIPIPRTERLRGGASIVRDLSDYIDRVEAEFGTDEQNMKPVDAP